MYAFCQMFNDYVMGMLDAARSDYVVDEFCMLTAPCRGRSHYGASSSEQTFGGDGKLILANHAV